MNMKLNKVFDKHLWSIPVFIGFILRIVGLTRSSIWHDEGYTMWLLKYNFGEILERTARDVHPPGYYVIAKPWVMVFGDSVFSIRFLSLIFSVGIIFLAYKIVVMLWDKRAAFYSSLFIALSPFLIRFGQEARMYGVVAFFTTLAAYFFIKYVKEKQVKNLVFFVFSMIIAMYTQYYSFFVIISLWLIFALITPEFWKLKWVSAIKEKKGIFDWKWWLANLSLLVLYLPWFPVAYKQVTRVGTSYWIKPEWFDIKTIPGNVLQFIFYSHLDQVREWQGALGIAAYWLIVILVLCSGLFLMLKKEKRLTAISLFVFGFAPMVIVYIITKLKTPIYQDRYFPFSAIAIFAIWGCVVSVIRNNKTRYITLATFVLSMLIGILVMRGSVNHQMKQLSDEVGDKSQASDIILSGSLYTYLDSAYYFGYDRIKFISNEVDGYGETSLFYDQQDKFIVSPTLIDKTSNRVWIIGRGNENYTENTPLANWRVSEKIEKAGINASLYTR